MDKICLYPRQNKSHDAVKTLAQFLCCIHYGIPRENKILPPSHGIVCTLAASTLTDRLLLRVPISTLFRQFPNLRSTCVLINMISALQFPRATWRFGKRILHTSYIYVLIKNLIFTFKQFKFFFYILRKKFKNIFNFASNKLMLKCENDKNGQEPFLGKVISFISKNILPKFTLILWNILRKLTRRYVIRMSRQRS